MPRLLPVNLLNFIAATSFNKLAQVSTSSPSAGYSPPGKPNRATDIHPSNLTNKHLDHSRDCQMPPISVAILGAGIFARIAHLPAIHKLNDTYELKAIYSRSRSSASELAETAESLLSLPKDSIALYHDLGGQDADLNALLARRDIQAVIVVLPINSQPSIVIKSLDAGKHVISEKPIAPTVKEGITLIKTYESVYKPKGLVWRVAENFEAEPGLRAAGKAITDQKIGKVCFWNLQVLNNVTTDRIDTFRVVGTEGTLLISKYNETDEATQKSQQFIKVSITNAKTGKTEEIVEKSCGVEMELANFARHLGGDDDGLGSPVGALKDVAIIQAGLDSNGHTINLQNLVLSDK
ncbi:hypothetical protein FRC14_000601 [Serendipita sp. 396]|nr:hypothetical protein FRC14_000601 [Serendipita sp. 396]